MRPPGHSLLCKSRVCPYGIVTFFLNKKTRWSVHCLHSIPLFGGACGHLCAASINWAQRGHSLWALWGVALWRVAQRKLNKKGERARQRAQTERDELRNGLFFPAAAAACRFISTPLPPRSTIESSGRMPCPNSLQLERLSV